MLPVRTSHSASSADKGDEDTKRPAPPNNKGGGQTLKKFQKGLLEGGNKGSTPQGDPICFSYNLGFVSRVPSAHLVRPQLGESGYTARLRRLNKKVHVPPPLRSSNFLTVSQPTGFTTP